MREALAHPAADRPLGETDAEALRSIGIDLDAVRDSVEATFVADALDRTDGAGGRRGWFARATGHTLFTSGAKEVLELALRETVTCKDTEIGAEHLMLGLLRGADPAFVAVIGPHVAPAELRRQVIELLDHAA